MTQTEPPLSFFQKQVRFQVYAQFVALGRVPTTEEVAQALSCSRSEVQVAYQQLAAGKALVLQESGEVLMAEPFSAVPTPFTVEVGNRSWWGNCIWDALGIPAMLKQDAHIITSCGCCNAAMTLEVRDGKLQQPDAGVVHVALPPRMWWNDVVFAWKTILLFRSEEHVERWCRQWHQTRGAIINLAQQWRLAQAWYEDRLTFDWRRKTTKEVDALWHELSFTSSFWSLA